MNELEAYKEAITSTAKGWPDTGIGFTEKETAQNLTVISRQLNTLLYTTLQLRIEVDRLREEIKKSQPQANTDIFKLTEQLDKVHISAKGVTFRESKGKIKVFRNPFNLLKEIQ